jgi:hypothetical protein
VYACVVLHNLLMEYSGRQLATVKLVEDRTNTCEDNSVEAENEDNEAQDSMAVMRDRIARRMWQGRDVYFDEEVDEDAQIESNIDD